MPLQKLLTRNIKSSHLGYENKQERKEKSKENEERGLRPAETWELRMCPEGGWCWKKGDTRERSMFDPRDELYDALRCPVMATSAGRASCTACSLATVRLCFRLNVRAHHIRWIHLWGDSDHWTWYGLVLGAYVMSNSRVPCFVGNQQGT